MSDELALRLDGRQSETALMIARGVRRLLRARGFSSLTELSLIDGRRADIVAVNGEGEMLIVEIKSSPADVRADRKWRDYAAACDRLYFAISEFDARRDHARRGRTDHGRPLRGRGSAGGGLPAHGLGDPAGAAPSLRPGGGRPAASPGRPAWGARPIGSGDGWPRGRRFWRSIQRFQSDRRKILTRVGRLTMI